MNGNDRFPGYSRNVLIATGSAVAGHPDYVTNVGLELSCTGEPGGLVESAVQILARPVERAIPSPGRMWVRLVDSAMPAPTSARRRQAESGRGLESRFHASAAGTEQELAPATNWAFLRG